ncbi:MAG TPA: DUF1232 domain-containing protein [Anaerolineales bacterium]|nr:DUF1232 domain-containing protein [Anaerolineae bacterium]HIQ02496.1 DUF1232 domain-containing protein [Anaerolineales bacterium]
MRDARLPDPREQTPSLPEETAAPISWIQELLRQARLAWRLFLDPRVPWITKMIPPAVLVYLLSPIDILPDFSLGLGQLDDIAVLLLGTKLFIDLCPTDVVQEHLEALGAKIEEWKAGRPTVIEGEFTVEGEGEEN